MASCECIHSIIVSAILSEIKYYLHSFKWPFLKAAVAFPIIGVDFLNNFKLAVDITNRRLTRSGHPYVKLSAPQSSGQVGVVAERSPTPTAGVAQQPQAASLCARPPAAVISLPSDPVLPFTGGGIDVAALAAAQPLCKEV